MPTSLRHVLRKAYHAWFSRLRRFQRAGRDAYCPCCGAWQRSFCDLVMPDRQCWVCGSLERHRLVSLLFDLRPELLTPGGNVLHVAPEAMIGSRLRRHAARYVSGDLTAEFGPARIDVLHLRFADATFDAVVCNHVLEHIPDDRRAMLELRRVLKPGGWAMLLVPDVQGPVTVESPGVTEPDQRLALYGQRDHVRRYGWDYLDRLRDAGFVPEAVRLGEVLSEETVRTCRLLKFGEVEPLFLAR